ncbi:PAS domain S-box protein [Phormidium yuhuli AB48]|uniref:histidine kinase n=1 Tax=Phormidium yuhuli AB48 TaxID=2940671 RepID=A0ABY5AUU4_9CYAN|nr:PAS domain S-box protein [Phormidium yuhuli]USR92004.1 PAS domain S-box protein [Phormidium yuhuli AB48]
MDEVIKLAGIEYQATSDRRVKTSAPPRAMSPKLGSSRINLGKFFDLSPDLLGVIGSDSHFKHLSPAWESVLGHSSQEMKSRPWLDWIHRDDLQKTLSHIHNLVIVGQDKVNFKNRLRCRNGNYRWLSWQANYDPHNHLIYTQASDLGERPGCSISPNLSGQKFNSPEEHFRLLVDGVKDHAIYMLDRHGRVISWNAGAERINGWQADEIIGQFSDIFFTVDSRQQGIPESVLRVAATSGRVEFENWRMRKDGSCFWANVTLSALQDEQGQLLGYATITRDVTDRKQEEEALQQAYDNLEKRVEERTAELQAANSRLREEVQIRSQTEEALRQSQQRLTQQASQLETTLRELRNTQAQLIHTEKMSGLGQLVAGVAHEINNPVGFIHGNLEHASHYVQDLLRLIDCYQEHYPNPSPQIQAELEDIDLDFIVTDMPKLLASMHQGTRRIQTIVESLCHFSGLNEAQYKPVDLHQALNSTLRVLQHRLQGHGQERAIELIRDYDQSLTKVYCFPGQVNQAFANVITNAIDALRDRENARSEEEYIPTLTVQTQHLGDRVRIIFEDNGLGMDESVRSRIFDPFFTTKPVGRGTGLGLSTTYQIIVEKHRGRLSCTSQCQQGTSIALELPLDANG